MTTEHQTPVQSALAAIRHHNAKAAEADRVICRHLKQLRIAAGMTQAQLASRVEIAPSILRECEAELRAWPLLFALKAEAILTKEVAR